jgi:hypothetical protein
VPEPTVHGPSEFVPTTKGSAFTAAQTVVGLARTEVVIFWVASSHEAPVLLHFIRDISCLPLYYDKRRRYYCRYYLLQYFLHFLSLASILKFQSMNHPNMYTFLYYKITFVNLKLHREVKLTEAIKARQTRHAIQ